MRFFDYKNNIQASKSSLKKKMNDFVKIIHSLDRSLFINELSQSPEEKIPILINRHLNQYVRKGGIKTNFVQELFIVKKELGKYKLTSEQEDAFITWLENADYDIRIKTTVEKKQKTPLAITFDELFNDTSLIEPCINILKDLNPPLINEECSYIGKSKGAFCVWINEMMKQGIIKHHSDRDIYAKLISQKIKNLSFHGSLFAKENTRAKELYGLDMKALLSKIKLSQSSQKRK